jgi:hypothetical protein
MSAIEPIDSKRISPVDRIPPAVKRERRDPEEDGHEQQPRKEPQGDDAEPDLVTGDLGPKVFS